VRRHARTDAAHVRLRFDTGETVLEVEDRGVGMPAELCRDLPKGRSGIGLLKMRERLEDLGGRLEIVSDGPGTLVRARLPYRKALLREAQEPAPPHAAVPHFPGTIARG
jgi:two-component system, NarL family, sensor kinase